MSLCDLVFPPPSTSGMQGVDQHTPSARGALVVGPSKTQFLSSFSVLPFGSLPQCSQTETPLLCFAHHLFSFQLRLGKFGKGRVTFESAGQCEGKAVTISTPLRHTTTLLSVCMAGQSWQLDPTLAGLCRLCGDLCESHLSTH